MSDEQRRPPTKGPRPAAKGPKPSNKGAKPTKKKAPASGERRPAVTAPDPTAVRGIVLVVVAVIIGFFMLAKGLDTESAIVDLDTGDVVKPDDKPQETVPGQTVPDGTGPTDSVLTPTTRLAAEVAVLVGNGSGVSGAAGAVTEQLQPLGYKFVEPSNAAQTPTTIIYYGEGYQADAEAIAASLGVDVANVKPMPEPAPPVDRIAEANVFIQLGPDKAPAA